MDCTDFCIHSHCPEALSQEATAFQYWQKQSGTLNQTFVLQGII